ncbi:MAG: 5-formyltetrahydrofolate cyclo-ligase [Candidatus Omnitrophica bacterium]|nr:5-formyltetrahydrofolate cyclo-ligase [Candidatus Omnitrophota bacterium]
MHTPTKQELRQKVLTLLRKQKEEERSAKSLVILDKLLKSLEFRRALTVLFYAAFDGEVDTFEMMQRAQQLGKRIGLPYIVRKEKRMIPTVVESIEEDLAIGPYGVRQPREASREKTLSVDELDLVIVPGVAFDRHNHRLGRGQGYYDRFLKGLSARTPTIGLAFDFQIVDHLPLQEEHDVPVSSVLVN